MTPDTMPPSKKNTPRAETVRRVLIVDDHPMMRLGLQQFLAQEPGIVVCGEAANATDALERIETCKPDLVLLDISLEGRSGLDLLKDLRIRFPELPVLVHSMHDERVFAERALRLGARGYLMKQEAGEQLNRAIHDVLDGKVYVSPRLRTAVAGPARGKRGAPKTPIALLSDREFEVFHLIGQGHVNQEIAGKLHISEKTVEAHREHIKRKLQVQTSTALNLLAVRWAGSEMVAGN